MIDTTEADGGSYPSPEKEKIKCYQFKFNGVISGYGIVYAEDIQQAIDKAAKEDYDDIIETWGMRIEDIGDVKEV